MGKLMLNMTMRARNRVAVCTGFVTSHNTEPTTQNSPLTAHTSNQCHIAYHIRHCCHPNHMPDGSKMISTNDN